jgi:hypothetical protein
LSLDLAEEAIAVDPHHRHCVARSLRSSTTSEKPGVMVAFRLEGEVVVFLVFADLRAR